MLTHFPSKIVPKVHFATEYSQIINDYGPATKLWCMRYEAYHCYFKKIALRSNNFKNISKTLATRYQLRQIFRSSKMIQMKNFDEAVGIQKVHNIQFNSKMKQVLLDHFGVINFAQDLLQCKKYSYENVEYCRSENEVDGETLAMMDSIEKTTTLFPKLKQQLLFLKEREKLFKGLNDSTISSLDSSSINSTHYSSISSGFEPIINLSTSDSMNDQAFEKSMIKEQSNSFFPDVYTVPTLPSSLLQDIESGALHKFGPHHTNRQILIDIITHDLINRHNLFYPTHKQFDNIGTAIVQTLKIPLTKDNIGIWKDAIQTKLKRKRLEHRDHVEVKNYQLKYSRFGSGRPVKKMIGEYVARDRQKQIMVLNYDDDTLNDIQCKAKQLRDDSQIDVNTRLHLWKETVHLRRKTIRDRPTSETLEEFPGYKDPVFIFEEVKMTMGVDLRSIVRRHIPILLEKITTTPGFITDSPPIQLIRVLCRAFEETIHHVYCSTAPLTPYPTLVFINDVIHVYVDFLPIVATTSTDDALALLLAMYAIFELNFHKYSRSIRLLYAIFFSDKRFLSNTLRQFVQDKQIDIYSELNQKQSINKNPIVNKTTQSNYNSSYFSNVKLFQSGLSIIEQENSINENIPNVDVDTSSN
ncbi:unnamed protein product, partial [Rotaria sp. Silwood2]